MKPTLPLQGAVHNLYRMMRNQWKVVRKRKVQPTNALKYCKENNLEVVEANDFVKEPKPFFE